MAKKSKKSKGSFVGGLVVGSGAVVVLWSLYNRLILARALKTLEVGINDALEDVAVDALFFDPFTGKPIGQGPRFIN